MKLAGYYTIQEAARQIGVSPSMVSRYIKHRELKAISLGKQKIIPAAAVDAFQRKSVGNPNFRRIGNG